ncbi:MAG: zf-TFIIB domain-containing protein [Myxococcota bacterium]
MNQCPKCRTMLYRRTFAGVQVDGCPSCGGSWFDAGELKTLVRQPDQLRRIDREFRPGVQPAEEKEIATCPRCGSPLTEMAHPSMPKLVVDACRSCRGIFLDHGEPTKLADERDPEGAAPVPTVKPAVSAKGTAAAAGAAAMAAASSLGPSDQATLGGAAAAAGEHLPGESTSRAAAGGLRPDESAASAPVDPAAKQRPAWLPDLSALDEEQKLELILRAVAIPAAMLLAWLAMQSSSLRMLGRMFMAMWVHELGHASTAWLFGHFAFPGPWITWSGESRNTLVILLVTAAIVLLGFHGLRRRSPVTISMAVLLLILQVMATGLASRQTADMMITFFGAPGQLVLGTLLMLSVYSPPGSKIHDGWLRWGFLVIGAVAFADALYTWLPTLTDFGAIPFGMHSHAGLSDASKLVDIFGWDERALIVRHIRVAQVCGLVLAAAWVVGLWRAARPR